MEYATKLVPRLGSALLKSLNTADEVWIAVALLTSKGLQNTIQSTSKKCMMHFAIGIDLPTEPRALKNLLELSKSKGFTTSLIINEHFYHPKAYVVRNGSVLTAFVGSANGTDGGFFNNIEMTVQTRSESACKDLVKWIEDQIVSGIILNEEIIKKYQKEFDQLKGTRKTLHKKSLKLKEKLREEVTISLHGKEKFISDLELFKASAAYPLAVKERGKILTELKSCLDYPSFENIDLDVFFSIHELGNILVFNKLKITADLAKFRRLLHHLCNEDLPVSKRLNDTLADDKFHVFGVGIAFITKILCIHGPKSYFIQNATIKKVLDSYSLSPSFKGSKGIKYQAMNVRLEEICVEVGIKDFAVLDYFMYHKSLE